MFPRLILLGVLVITIVVIASRSIRSWNTELPEVSELDRLETTVGKSGGTLADRFGGSKLEDSRARRLPVEVSPVEVPTETHRQSVASPVTSVTPTNAVSIPTTAIGTPIADSSGQTLTVDVEKIHKDMVELEWIMRRYLSGGHKISRMNFNTLKEFGYLSQEQYPLAERYNIGFQPSGDGFDLWIEPKFELSDEVKNSLLGMRNVKLMDGKVRYVFWIRAYR